MEFTHDEYQTLTHALAVAADRFDEDAKVMAASNLPEHQRKRLVEQFERQARESRALLERIECRS